MAEGDGGDFGIDGVAGRGARLWFSVLGSVRAWRGVEPVDIGQPQQRALLAVLLLRGGRTTTAPELVDALWGESPPRSALATLRTYASRLRKAFGPDADLLVSESGGYALRLGADELDLDRAEWLAAEAERARESGDLARSRALLCRAVRLWRGEPLHSAPGPYCQAQRVRLEERRLALLEARIQLDLELGRAPEVVTELTALTAAHPLLERLRELLMLALFRCGRRTEALAVYADARRLLADELGLTPRPELCELHRRILRADTAPAVPDDGWTGHPDSDPAFIKPAQLPASVADFTGRAALAEQLGEGLAPAPGRAATVAAVVGVGGVGKTTLAVHVAHAVRQHFPDGQLFVDLQGAGPSPADPEAVLGTFLRALGIPDPDVPEGMAERSALYRSTLGGRRVLVLLDNARDTAQVGPLIPASDGSTAVITSRARLSDLAGAQVVNLDALSPQEALDFFTRVVGEERVDAARDAALEVVTACGFLPLALRIAASRLAARRAWSVIDLARRLADERRRLDELTVGDLAVSATFELGYGQLDAQQARAFRLLGLADGPDISLPAAAAVLGLDRATAGKLLGTVVDTSLLESPVPGRYRYHDLLHLYARARAERDEEPAERDAAMSRLLDFYLATAARAYASEQPGDTVTEHLAATREPGLAFTDQSAALDWLFTEAANLLACARAAADAPADGTALRRAADLLLVSRELAESGADARQFEQVTAHLPAASQESGETRAEGRLRLIVARAHLMAGRFAEAAPLIRAALTLARRLRHADPVLYAQALDASGLLAGMQRRYEEAETYMHQAREAYRHYGNRSGEADAMGSLSRAFMETGRVAEARDMAERALAIYQEAGGGLRTANGMYQLGLALARSGRPYDALTQLGRAAGIFHERRQRLWEAGAYCRMADIHLAERRPDRAATLGEQALAALRGTTGGEWRRGNALTVLGHALHHMGHSGRARACLQDALTIFERLDSPETGDVRRLLDDVAIRPDET